MSHASFSLENMRELLNDSAAQDDEAFVAAFWLQMVGIILFSQKHKRVGSVPGKAANIERNYAAAHRRYMLKYFWPSNMRRPDSSCCGPEQPEKAFERRFRVSRRIFNRLLSGVVTNREYFRRGLNPNATGKLGISLLLQVICAMRQLAFGQSSDLSDDLFDVSETTANTCLEEFCRGVIETFGPTYLRVPTNEDVYRTHKAFEKAGFPGCIGCLDCAGWEWKNCPKALQGTMIGKDGTPVVRMEVIADLDQWIWSLQFGLPGVLNDISILDMRDHFQSVLSGTFPSNIPSYIVGGRVINRFYYLTDGIYPSWKVFIKKLSDPQPKKERAYYAAQEGIRKSVERVFGVLYRQFKILTLPCEYWTIAKMAIIMKCAVAIHDMIVEERGGEYGSDGTAGRSVNYNEEQCDVNLVMTTLTNEELESRLIGIGVVDDVKLSSYNRRLTKSLIDHI